MRAPVAAVVGLLLGVLAVAALYNATTANDAADDLARNQIVLCERGDILSAYLQKRGRTLKGSTPQDRAVVAMGRPVVDCETQKSLPRPEQDRYIRTLFRCVCQPVIADGRVTSRTKPFR